MILSRLIYFKRASCMLRPLKLQNGLITRNHGNWKYREANIACGTLGQANFFGGIVMFWIFWHLFTEPGHIFGEFPYPDPSEWTDEELGIPST